MPRMYGCLEPTKAVTKGKPHVFETQSDNPNLNPLFSFYKLYYNLIDVWQFIFLRTDWSIVHKNQEQEYHAIIYNIKQCLFIQL